MRRREFITLLGGAAVAWPLAARAQQSDRVRRIGMLLSYVASDAENQARVAAFQTTLHQLGWTEGRNVTFEFRYAEGKLDRLAVLATELVRMNVDVILTAGTEPIDAARKATSIIPIVMATVGDPVAAGFVASLARPGGNVTGLSLFATELSAKRLELLKETLPGLKRLAMILNPDNASVVLKSKEIEAAARVLGVQIQSLQIRNAEDIEKMLEPAMLANVDAVITTDDALQLINRSRIITLAKQGGIPVAAELGELARTGALISYGPSVVDLWRRAAGQVDKILKGVKPADIPVEQPTRFELIINLKTAEALGLTVPPTLLTRADEVIE
jgi:putative ABC transport system substrate-binding protein